uniref:Paternally expressed 10 n=1 Tax=Jaculus jaculus TaxID=51337 RepID=A0A8C5KBS0_JACJA|nr:retrotransposon-derived protein PEG10 isoform 2 [Jaculus jaculus]
MGPADCPPPPPPPPPNNNNNNNSKPKGPCVPNMTERRRDELSEEINNLREKVIRQSEENSDLQNQVQKLTEENSTLREQVEPPEPEEEDDEDDIELQGAAAAATPATPIEEECPEDLPEKFDGNPDMLAPFMSQCQVFMEKSTRDFSLDRVRVCFVTSMMTGRAARWASAKLERSNYLMHNYPAFMMEMKHVFEDPQRREAAKRKIRRLRQGQGSVVDYANAFQMIAQDLDWNEPALIDQFHEGLSEQIQEELSRGEAPKTLSQMINQCIHIERRLARAAAARKPRSPPRAMVAPQMSGHQQVDPTEPVGGARMRLTQEEKERRRKLNLCLYCGNGGHYADNCPAKASKSSPAGNSPAPL